MSTNRPYRCWINQPSTHQPLHAFHGVDVLAIAEDEGFARVYPLEGPTVSFRVRSDALSKGWCMSRVGSDPARTVKVVQDLAAALEAFVSHAEAGFLDEVPSFKPDVYHNDLVRNAIAALRLAGREQEDRP